MTDADHAFKGRLVFEPYQAPGNVVAAGVWQTWNTLAGKWWLTQPGLFPLVPCSQSTPCKISDLTSHYKNIGIRDVPGQPNTILKAGGGWSNFDGNTDALTVGIGGSTTIYNFELGPTNKDECKNGGWEGIYKNQGQCVSSFQSSN